MGILNNLLYSIQLTIGLIIYFIIALVIIGGIYYGFSFLNDTIGDCGGNYILIGLVGFIISYSVFKSRGNFKNCFSKSE